MSQKRYAYGLMALWMTVVFLLYFLRHIDTQTLVVVIMLSCVMALLMTAGLKILEEEFKKRR